MNDVDTPDELLAEQKAYYSALAPEYKSLSLPVGGGPDVLAALDALRPAGDILELACGPGIWTERLLRDATTLTAVDASPEMLALAKARIGEKTVRFIEADLFTWEPDRRYDVVFFGFWLSHVPRDRFARFWSMIADCLEPDGIVFFVDDAMRPIEELIEGERSSTVQRKLSDGRAFRAVKVPYRPADLEALVNTLGWQIRVHQTSEHVYWGAGRRV